MLMKYRIRLKEQLQRNTVALISLVVAITSLAYNTWRNEASEGNRNQRLISIEILRNLAELQEVILYGHYEMDDTDRGNPKTGWSLVLTIKDLSRVLEGPVPATAEQLWTVWGKDFEGLGSDDQSKDRIVEALEAVREDTHALLRSLD